MPMELLQMDLHSRLSFRNFCFDSYGPTVPHLPAPAEGVDRHMGNSAYAFKFHCRSSVLCQDEDEGRLWVE